MWRSVRSLREEMVKETECLNYCLRNRLDKWLLLCMSHYPTSAMVQSQCLRALATLAFGNDNVGWKA